MLTPYTGDFVKAGCFALTGQYGDKSMNTLARMRTNGVKPQSASTTSFLLPDVVGPSVISPRVELTGSISSSDELHIYGTVDGSVRASALVICKGGMVRGDVIAESVLVHGSVEGSIQGMKVQLFATAAVRGDIVHGSLEIDPAAMFEGGSKRIPPPVTLNG
jgi:cytoskeletal protein CcmA (bactofilin family)